MAYFFALSRARFLTKMKPNSAHIFLCYCIKQLDSMLPCVCSVINHRRRQNVVRTSVTHSATPRVPHFDVICYLLLNRRTTTWNLVVNYNTVRGTSPDC